MHKSARRVISFAQYVHGFRLFYPVLTWFCQENNLVKVNLGKVLEDCLK